MKKLIPKKSNVPKIVPGGVTASSGFLASGKDNLALIYSTVPAVCIGMFTTNKVTAAPVQLTKSRVKDNTAQAVSDTKISKVFSNMDGLGRDERVRYDSPSFHGFVGSASYIADGGGDVALRYNAQLNTLKLAAAVAYADPGSTSETMDSQVSGSVSLLHDSGINLTVASGSRDHKEVGRNSAGYVYAKLGYRADWCPLGKTSLSVDYGNFADIGANGDTADTVGVQVVQDLHDWSSDAFLGYRFHNLDRTGGDYNAINAVMIGMRVKF